MASFLRGRRGGGSYHIGGDGQRAVCSDARTKQKTENSFVVVNGEVCGSPKQHDTFRENVKKKSHVGELAKKKKRLRHSQQSKSESNRGLTKGDGL